MTAYVEDFLPARRSDAARNAHKIVAAAVELVSESGYDFSLDEVARRAGVASGTLYRNFPTRMDLILATCSSEINELCEQGRNLLQSQYPADALFTWLKCFADHVGSKHPIALAFGRLSREDGETMFGRWYDMMYRTTADLLNRAQRNGSVRCNIVAADLLALGNALALTRPESSGPLFDLLRGAVEEDSPTG